MGMYDTINGEQVKCFPWVSLYHDEISYHGGDLKYYGNGSDVPYRKPHYNYGMNFVIIDINRLPESEWCDYDYILHVIVGGKVKKTFKDKVGKIDWSNNNLVVGYRGELINIHSKQGVLDYIKAQRDYWSKYEEINSHWNELFKELSKYMHGLGLLESGSEEKELRYKKLEEIQKLMDEEKKRIQPDIDSLIERHSKWFVDKSDIEDLIHLGDYISSYETELKIDEETDAEKCKEMIVSLLQSDSSLYDRYVRWQGSDEYIKEFKR